MKKTYSSALKVANDYRMKHIVQETKIHKVILDLEELESEKDE